MLLTGDFFSTEQKTLDCWSFDWNYSKFVNQLCIFITAIQGCKQRAGLQVQQLGPELVSTWDASTTFRGLACCTISLAPTITCLTQEHGTSFHWLRSV